MVLKRTAVRDQERGRALGRMADRVKDPVDAQARLSERLGGVEYRLRS